MKRAFLFITLLVGMVSAAWAQVDDVTLVVSGEGITKDEATTKALRSAIEQAFGVFVSANTEILNDELVKDEIATISSGNVKSYTELGSITKSNGNIEVSLQATVSVKQLTSYAKNHGSKAEFAGATFAANLKLKTLNNDNTAKAISNLVKQINSVGTAGLYSCEITVGNVTANGTINVELQYYTTEKAYQLAELIVSTIDALALSGTEVGEYSKLNLPIYKYSILEDFYSWSRYSRAIDKCYYLSVPLPTVNIAGNLFDIFDNMGNKYELKNSERYGAYMVPNYGAGPYGPSQKYAWGRIDYTNANTCAHGKKWRINVGETPCYTYLGYDIVLGEDIIIPKCYLEGVSWKKVKENGKKVKKMFFKPQKVCTIRGFIEVPASIISQLTNLEVKERQE